MRYAARRPDAEPAAKRNWPAGSRQNALGTGSVEICPTAANRPVPSTANPAMLLWPRLPTYRKRADGVRWICEQVFRAVCPLGRVVIVCVAEREPLAVSRR